MPRQARLDAPGALHHVIVRWIEKRRMVTNTLQLMGGTYVVVA